MKKPLNKIFESTMCTISMVDFWNCMISLVRNDSKNKVGDVIR
jgi:hypothetical protein